MAAGNYIGAYFDWDTQRVLVWERVEGERVLKTYPAEYYFYVPREGGTYKGLHGEELERLDFDNRDEFDKATRRFGAKYESDIPPLFKCLMNNYHDLPTPEVNFAFIDIEVDYKSSIGFAGPANPYAIINAVTIYQSWTKSYRTFVVVPTGPNGEKQWSGSVSDLYAHFDALIEKGDLRKGQYPEITICENEAILLQRLVEQIQDADIISGWNSEFYDLPYIIRRLQLVWPKLVNKLCFIGCKPPKEREVDKFGAKEKVFSLNGRTHLDYKDLFQKFTFEGRTSYALGNILAEEIGLSKLHYEGTLEQLYHNDFPTFVAYNFRDVSGLVDLDDKFKFIQLVNQMAHENTCLFENMLGTVRYVETGIANRAHNVHNMRVPDKRMMTDGVKVEGALVLNPRVGLHEWIGSVDINSLYPSVIRALNISPEMFIGQFREGEWDWEGISKGDSDHHTMRDDDGQEFTATGAEWRVLLAEQKWAITAYGSVFDQSRGLGLVPDTLAYWFTERKRLQAEKKKYTKLLKDDTLSPEKRAEYEKLEAHYDLLQLTKKIQLNSTYGALLNVAFRFGRKEMGASVTACGRHITKYMMEKINLLIVEKYYPIVKRYAPGKDDGAKIAGNGRGFNPSMDLGGDEDEVDLKWDDFINKPAKGWPGAMGIYATQAPAIIYGDTDSCYFLTFARNKEDAVRIADETAAKTNASFPEFMRNVFFCQPTYDDLIKAGREVVAERGLFQAKKKYVLKVVDLEGFAVDKLKSQGSEIKKADTPKIIQDFLKDLMRQILSGEVYNVLEDFVNTARKKALGKSGDIFAMGVAKQVNNLDAFHAAWIRSGRPSAGKVSVDGGPPKAIPGHIRAAIQYNEVVKLHEDGAKQIGSGDKVKIFYLKPNKYGYRAIGIPAEMDSFPAWFNEEFQVDRQLTEEKMFDAKLQSIFGAIGWDVPTPRNALVNKILKF